MTVKNIKSLIFLFILFVGIGIPLLVDGFGNPPIYCISESDCDNSACPKSIKCLDDQAGYQAKCQATESVCPMNSACKNYAGTAVEECVYEPIFRQENCCDNSGWDNVKRCGGCCSDGNCQA